MTGWFRLASLGLLLVAPAATADERAGTPADWPPPMPDPGPYWMLEADRLESSVGEGADAYEWALQGWYGGDKNRLRWKSDGSGTWGEAVEHAEVQLLFSRLFSPYWEWHAGLRHDLRPRNGSTYLVLGLQGMAPYKIEIDASLFVSDDGEASVRTEAEYDLKLTQRWILQPHLELDMALSDVPALGLSSGDIHAELGIRLGYEVKRELTPYLGISVEHDSSGTETVLLAGLSFWL